MGGGCKPILTHTYVSLSRGTEQKLKLYGKDATRSMEDQGQLSLWSLSVLERLIFPRNIYSVTVLYAQPEYNTGFIVESYVPTTGSFLSFVCIQIYVELVISLHSVILCPNRTVTPLLVLMPIVLPTALLALVALNTTSLFNRAPQLKLQNMSRVLSHNHRPRTQVAVECRAIWRGLVVSRNTNEAMIQPLLSRSKENPTLAHTGELNTFDALRYTSKPIVRLRMFSSLQILSEALAKLQYASKTTSIFPGKTLRLATLQLKISTISALVVTCARWHSRRFPRAIQDCRHKPSRGLLGGGDSQANPT